MMDMRVEPDTLVAEPPSPPVSVVADYCNQRSGDTVTEEKPKIDEWTACLMQIQSDRDKEAFVRLFRHFAPRAKAYLMKSGASASLAEETTQEAMAQVWHKADRFDPAKASAATWIFTILRNKQIDAIRKTKRPEPEDLPWGNEAPRDPEEIVETSQQENRLRQAVRALPQKQRIIVEKAFFSHLSHSEIAEVTGLPLGTIKSRIRLALDRLRHELKDA